MTKLHTAVFPYCQPYEDYVLFRQNPSEAQLECKNCEQKVVKANEVWEPSRGIFIHCKERLQSFPTTRYLMSPCSQNASAQFKTIGTIIKIIEAIDNLRRESQMKRLEWWAIATGTTLLSCVWSSQISPAFADSIVPATDGTGTQVIQNGSDYAITGGTTSADDQNLFHSFQDFSLLTGESATFLTDPTVLNILGRVNGSEASLIDGLLQVSGSEANLFLINPNGILFGPNSALNLQGSFTATTADQVNFATGEWGAVGNTDYTSLVGAPESFSFTLDTPGNVVNSGSLAVEPEQSVVLVGGQVLNTGTITASGGEIIISAVEGGSLVRIEQSGALLNLEVETLPTGTTTSADVFTPLSLPELLTGSAIASASNVTVNPDGTVRLDGETPVNTETGSATVAGTVDVTAEQGGQVLVLGNAILLSDAVIQASGELGGGLVRIGGNYQGQGDLPRSQRVQIDAGSVIQADALAIGDGGRVIVWADGETLFAGRITARGGAESGDGGLVETSGLQTVQFADGSVDASATQGLAGLWLVDPGDIFINEAEASQIEEALANGTSFTVSTVDGDPTDLERPPEGEGDIFLLTDIDAIATNNSTLTLTASRYIEELVEVGNVVINIAGGNLVLNLNQEGLAAPENPTLTNALNVVGNVTGTTTVNLGTGVYQEGATVIIDANAIGGGLFINGVSEANTSLDGQDTYRVLTVDGGTVFIRNLTVQNGEATDDENGINFAGGIFNRGNLTLTDVEVRENRANNAGGGILNIGNLNISNSTITENVAGDSGGGIANSTDGILNISESTISFNTAENNGGGVDNFEGEISIANSFILNNTTQNLGGGVYNTSRSVEVIGSNIFENSALSGGGIANGPGSTFTVTGSTINDNSSDAQGGGVFNEENGSLQIANSAIEMNTAIFGGGIANVLGDVAIADTFIRQNSSNADGGGILNTGTLSISDSRIQENQAGTDEVAGSGGGIFSEGSLDIDTSQIQENTAQREGGGIITSSSLTLATSTVSGNVAVEDDGGGINVIGLGSATISNTTISDNSAGENGGGIDLDTVLPPGEFSVNILNSTISGNSAANIGGGFSLGESSALNLNQATVTANTAVAGGSGLANLFGGSAVVSNTILAENTTDNVAGLITEAGPNVIDVEPLLAPLTNNGGPTETHALLEGSPAIDAGNGSGPDQRGIPVSNTIRDIGAFESQAAPPPEQPETPEQPEQPEQPETPEQPDTPDIPEQPPETPETPDIPEQPPETPETPETPDIPEQPSESPTEQPEEELLRCVSGECAPRMTPEAVSLAELPSTVQPIEAEISKDYEDHLGIQAQAFADFDVLRRAEELLGVRNAIIYARFVSDGKSASPQTDRLELLLVIGEGEPQRVLTETTRGEALAAIKRLHIELTDRTRRRLDNYLVPAQSLYNWLVTPVEATLQRAGVGHISFVLDKGLRSLPIAAMHDGNQFIIETYSVGLMPSLTLTDTRIGDVRNASVLAMGASTFEEQPPLPAVPLELAAINSLWSSDLHLNETFTPETVLAQRSEETYPILHLATHGQFTNGSPDDSYIQFWDRRLSLAELPQLQLDEPPIELLVLSACRTLIGGEEAELGFAGVAVQSGAKTAIAALWQVSDLETAGLMAELYTQLERVNYKAAALQQAQLAMLRGEVTVQENQLVWSGGSIPLPDDLTNVRFVDTSHPFFWSAFTLVGSPW